MSRIGKNPVPLKPAAQVDVQGQTIKVKGPKGELTYTAPIGVTLKIEGNELIVERLNNSKPLRAMHGTVRALAANMIEGVTNGYVKELEIQGVGFKAVAKGNIIVLSLGYSHEINFEIPEGLTIALDGNGTLVKISGCDKQQVGQAAAQIRSYYKAEPYKGKGVRYKGEVVRRKAGKAVA